MPEESPPPLVGKVVEPLDRVEALRLTAEIRSAIEDVRKATTRLSAAVKQAHDGRAYLTLGYPSWKAYAKKEFGVGRSHAYRLVDEAATTSELAGALVELGMMSPTGDTSAVLDQLSGRDWREIKGRAEEVARLVSNRAADTDGPLTGPVLHDLVLDAVRDVRATPPTRGSELAAIGEEDDLQRDIRLFSTFDQQHARIIGDRALELAPAYLPEDQALTRIEPVVADFSESPAYVLACRRFALSGDPRALAEFARAEEIHSIIADYNSAAFAVGDAALAAAPMDRVPSAQLVGALLALDVDDPKSVALEDAFLALRTVQRRIGELALTVFPAQDPWDQGACDRISALAKELDIHFGEVFASRLFALTGSDLPLRFLAEVSADTDPSTDS